MLAMSRNSGEYVVIGENIVVQVVNIGGQIRLAIDAPKDVTIERGENYEKTHPAPESIRRLRDQADPPKPFRFHPDGVSGSSGGR